MTEFVFSEKDNGALAEVTLGSKVTIELPENPTAGHKWIVTAVDQIFLVAEGDAFLVGRQMGLAGGGVRRFFFRAKGTGCTSLSLIEQRTGQSDPDAIGSFRLAVRILK